MKTVIITGISGVLGSALGRFYLQAGWKVIGVSRRDKLEADCCSEFCSNQQQTMEDAQELLNYEPNLVFLNAGQIETDVDQGGLPRPDQLASITSINYLFPANFCLAAAKQKLDRSLDVIAIGSIADGSPSCFGPVYHASKIALHYFMCGVGPIVNEANPKVRMRLYRPGAIKGPLAWAPVNRLNKRGYQIRAKRVNGAPEGDLVAKKIAEFVDSKAWIGTYDEPFSFKILKYLFALLPNGFYKLQIFGWKKGSKYTSKDQS